MTVLKPLPTRWPWRLPSATARPESTFTTRRFSKLINEHRLEARNRDDDELGDSVAGLDPENLGWIVVEQKHSDLPSIPGINKARSVHQRYSVAQRQTGPRHDQTRVAFRDLDRQSGCDLPPFAGAYVSRLSRMKVQTSIPFMGS